MTSPFLPNTYAQFAWDSTSLGWLKRCPRSYYYAMIEGWRAKGAAVDLVFGIHIHKAFETYERRKAQGLDYETNLRETVRETLGATWNAGTPETDGQAAVPAGPWATDHPNKNRHTLLRSIIWYLDSMQRDTAETLILGNGIPAVELTFRFDVGDGIFLCGHLDRVVEIDGMNFVMDHKTTKTTISPDYFRQYDIDTQMSLYTLAGQVVHKVPVRGVIINAIQVAVGFTRFERGFTHRTPDQLNEWLLDTKRWIQLSHFFADNMTSSTDAEPWLMNDKACRLCEYRTVCSRDPNVRQSVLDTYFERREWNPLIPR